MGNFLTKYKLSKITKEQTENSIQQPEQKKKKKFKTVAKYLHP